MYLICLTQSNLQFTKKLSYYVLLFLSANIINNLHYLINQLLLTLTNIIQLIVIHTSTQFSNNNIFSLNNTVLQFKKFRGINWIKWTKRIIWQVEFCNVSFINQKTLILFRLECIIFIINHKNLRKKSISVFLLKMLRMKTGLLFHLMYRFNPLLSKENSAQCCQVILVNRDVKCAEHHQYFAAYFAVLLVIIRPPDMVKKISFKYFFFIAFGASIYIAL